MADTILFELVYDKDGYPDIQITMDTAKRGLRRYSLNNCPLPNFEDLPDAAQIETLYSLFLRIYKNYDEAEKELITSETKARNKRKFDDEVMDRYVEIVNEWQKIRPGKFWDDALNACKKYSKENHPFKVYEKISKTQRPAFTKMMTNYIEHPPL